MAELIMIRHAEVEARWKSICYGASDVPLSEAGLLQSQRLADRWKHRPQPICVYHSGVRRTELLARMIAGHFPSLNLVADARLCERDYGDWQGKGWDEVYAADPDFDRLIHQPDSYRPPRGESTSVMQSRIAAWFASVIKSTSEGTVVAISHSGPMAALAGHCLNLHASQWEPWMMKPLEAIRLRWDRCDGKVHVSRDGRR